MPHIPDFLWSLVGTIKLYAPFLKERRTRGRVQSCVQEIRGVSLVFREMWDITAADLHSSALQGEPIEVPNSRCPLRFVVGLLVLVSRRDDLLRSRRRHDIIASHFHVKAA